MNNRDQEPQELGEGIAIRFAGFIAGFFIFLYFLQESEGNQLFLFLSFIGLSLGIFTGFSAWSDIQTYRKRRDRERHR